MPKKYRPYYFCFDTHGVANPDYSAAKQIIKEYKQAHNISNNEWEVCTPQIINMGKVPEKQ